MKLFIIYGQINKLIVYASGKSSAKRRFSNYFPFDKIIYTQIKTK
jgi:hypothetical protein